MALAEGILLEVFGVTVRRRHREILTVEGLIRCFGAPGYGGPAGKSDQSEVSKLKPALGLWCKKPK